MALTIYDFIQHVKSHGIQRANRFEVQISLPSELSNSDIEETLSLMATNVDLPGLNVSAVDMHVGTTRSIPYDKSTGDLNISFLCSGEMREKVLFDKWIKLIFKSDHSVGYYDDYTTDINVTTLDLQDNEVYKVTFNEAYPLVITDLNLDRKANDSTMEFQVTFKYRKMLTDNEFYDDAGEDMPVWQDNDIKPDDGSVTPGSFPDVFNDAKNKIEEGIYKQGAKIKEMVDNAGILKGPATKLLNIVKGKVTGIAADKAFPITTKINNVLDKVGYKKVDFPTIDVRKWPF